MTVAVQGATFWHFVWKYCMVS